MTAATCVCWSIISLIQIAYRSCVCRHGKSRAPRSNQASAFRANARRLLADWTFITLLLWSRACCILALPLTTIRLVPRAYSRRQTEATMRLEIDVEREDDGRWIAEVSELPGVLAYGASKAEAI